VVEFALVAPLVFLMFLAIFEFSRIATLRHTAGLAAFEGARRGIVPGATVSGVQSHAQNILRTVGVTDATIQVTPSQITNQTASITVNISVPLATNAWVPFKFLRSASYSAACTLKRERV
jgi:Flp pilus assembly protein TadG